VIGQRAWSRRLQHDQAHLDHDTPRTRPERIAGEARGDMTTTEDRADTSRRSANSSRASTGGTIDLGQNPRQEPTRRRCAAIAWWARTKPEALFRRRTRRPAWHRSRA
jgi:hypothetical protein